MLAGPWKEDEHGDIVSHYPNGVVAGVVWAHGWWIQGPDAKPENGALEDEWFEEPFALMRVWPWRKAVWHAQHALSTHLVGLPAGSTPPDIIWRTP